MLTYFFAAAECQARENGVCVWCPVLGREPDPTSDWFIFSTRRSYECNNASNIELWWKFVKRIVDTVL